MPTRLRRLLFLTGTRADFGKLKPLLASVATVDDFETFIFTTGMHMLKRYGSTWEEVDNSRLGTMYPFVNQTPGDGMDTVLAKTVSGLSDFVKEIGPDLIVVHGDRTEALAGALVGTFNRVRVAHVEGGELSGTVDETIRHAITKLSHVHFVSNGESSLRLLQMGELGSSIFIIGSPEVDIMSSGSLPSFDAVRTKYEIPFDDYGVLIFHPVTTEIDTIEDQAREVVSFALESGRNFLAIQPNNDYGTELVERQFELLRDCDRVRMLPSMRFEYYLTALKHAQFVVGNSSSGIREAPFFGIPSINVGTRQSNRSRASSVVDAACFRSEIAVAVDRVLSQNVTPSQLYGDGKSGERFKEIILSGALWKVSVQKSFVDLPTSSPSELS